MQEAVRSRDGAILHYRNLTEANQARVCRMLGRRKARIFVVASQKDSMRDYYNPRLGKANGQQFYNLCLRLLLERVTEWCFLRSRDEGHPDCSARIVFSHRGGHNYDKLRIYLRRLEAQSLTGNLVLSKKGIAPGVITDDKIEVETDVSMAGLHLADIAVSAFFNAANSLAPKHALEPAKSLKVLLPKNRNTKMVAGTGLLMLPFQHQASIPIDDRKIFEECGYVF